MDLEIEQQAQEKKNSIKIEGEIVTVTLYLDQDAGPVKALGSLEMAKDVVKGHCQQRAIREAQLRSLIVRPGRIN